MKKVEVGQRYRWPAPPHDIATITEVKNDIAYFECDSDNYKSNISLEDGLTDFAWVLVDSNGNEVKSEASAVNPSHYNGTEVFEQMIKLFGTHAVKGFCICNAYKYRARAGKKSDNIEEDIKKAMWYEAKLKELDE